MISIRLNKIEVSRHALRQAWDSLRSPNHGRAASVTAKVSVTAEGCEKLTTLKEREAVASEGGDAAKWKGRWRWGSGS